NPETVASCIPGATLSSDQEDDLWKGSISVKFGPTVAVFRGEADLTYDHDAHTCTIEGRGIDQRGASRALANGLVTATGNGDTTELAVSGEYSVSGPLETFANAGGVHVARALLAEFATNMSKLTSSETPAEVSAGAGGDPGTAPPAVTDGAFASGAHVTPSPQPSRRKPQPAKELNAFALLWAAFKSWISSLFGKRN
ncbi:MAG: SRPBCC family protein, partial [Alphaproteobacteria bacterium]|nr:SRPBCC family protein [Alphaproteobacteria bacterium]